MKSCKGVKRGASNRSDDRNSSAKRPKRRIVTQSKNVADEEIIIDSKNKNNKKDDENHENTCSINTAVEANENATKVKQESGSESSSDEFIKAPFSLDELGRFDNIQKDTFKVDNKPSCSLASPNTTLSDDDSVDENQQNESHFYDFSEIIKSQQFLTDTQKKQNEKTSQQNQVPSSSDLKIKHMSKKPLKRQKLFSSVNCEELGVSELLNIGESSNAKLVLTDDYNLGVSSDDNNSTLEEKYSVPKDGVQVTIELPNLKKKRESKGFDVEAAMKRRINLIRKENQIFMHKVHVLCWIAHCLYLNRTINNDDLLGVALSLIPSKHCYPPKHADLSYLEKLVDWFVNKVSVVSNHKDALKSSQLLPLLDVLEKEINLKVAFSLKDLVLIFVCMLRSLGISARLMVSLQPVPLRPPVSDLCHLNKNGKDENVSCNSKVIKSEKKDKSNNSLELSDSKIKKPLEVTRNQSDSKCKSHYFEKPETSKVKMENKNTIKKRDSKSCLNKQQNCTQSPYFSSSDELPLKELIHKKNLKTKAQTSSAEKICTKLPKSTNSIKSSPTKLPSNTVALLKSLKSNKRLNSRKNSTNESKDNSTTKIKTHTSFNSNFNSPSNKLLNEKNDNKIKEEPIKSGTKSRRSYPKQCFESFFESSEEEADFVEITPKQKKSISKPKSSNSTSGKVSSHKRKADNDEDTDFECPKPSTSKNKTIDRRVLSSDDDNSNSKKVGNDFWIEVFLEAEEKWISVDLKKKKVHCIQQLYNGATHPVRYVLACNNDGSLKDVTRRYAPQWLTVTRKLRAEDKWWEETISPYLPHRTQRERDEDEDLDRQMHDKPLPTSIAEYKNHPLFALRRHLLKFEAIYPPDAPPFGFVRGEPVYSRGCVAQLHTRETWIKEAKVVRRGEEPYKIVKARPKWDKLSQTVINDLPLPLFGHWQVEDYIPPPAVDGKVPRNEYGNVELYKPCMLPPGTVHLQVPMLARVARKLGIDCAPAVVGWEFSGGSSHPVLEGFVVCEEMQDVLLDAWNKEVDESAKRAKEKVEQRVYGNWKRLIKGLLIRERLQHRYDFGSDAPGKKKKKQNPKASTSKP